MVSGRSGAPRATKLGRGPSARRLAANGASVAEAVMSVRSRSEGALARVSDWTEMEAAGYGMSPNLLELARRERVTDILINGPDTWVDQGGGLEPFDLDLGGPSERRALAIRMAAAAGQRLDDASPIVDGTIRGDIRLHAVLPPLAQSGVSISLRIIRTLPFKLEELVVGSTLDSVAANRLRAMVEQQHSILISGATGVGKTTLLATLLGLVPLNQRIVCIEEISEIAATHPHLVRLQARQANVEGEGGTALEDLVRAAVRMRPDRLVLGECRGPEVREVLTAMNTGHRGSFATIHANSIRDVPARLTALGMLGGMSSQAVAALAGHAFDTVLHLRRSGSGQRYLAEIGRLVTEADGLRGVVDTEYAPPGARR